MIANKEYRRLDFNKIAFDKKTIPYEESVKSSTSLNVSTNIQVTKVKKDYKNKCVKLETSY